ncbi:MAG: hypothetical protein JNL32_13070, partial [Candidatus Kapabacteria bacterium]|nr:hypothetical protein [Candidatus Kapabacteria bacterium]
MTTVTQSRHQVLEYLLQKILWCILVLVPLLTANTFAQSTTRTDPATGFTMTKVVSNTSVNIGQPFSYTVSFNIPPGTTTLTLTDIIPASLQILNNSFAMPCTTLTPTVTLTGNTYTMTL